MRWEVNSHAATVLWSSASMICLKRHAASSSGSAKHFFFFLIFRSDSKWCNHRLVLTLLQLRRIPVLFYQRSNFDMVINLSISHHSLPKCSPTSLSVDGMLPARYMNWFTNLIGLLFNKMLPSWLKEKKSGVIFPKIVSPVTLLRLC